MESSVNFNTSNSLAAPNRPQRRTSVHFVIEGDGGANTDTTSNSGNANSTVLANNTSPEEGAGGGGRGSFSRSNQQKETASGQDNTTDTPFSTLAADGRQMYININVPSSSSSSSNIMVPKPPPVASPLIATAFGTKSVLIQRSEQFQKQQLPQPKFEPQPPTARLSQQRSIDSTTSQQPQVDSPLSPSTGPPTAPIAAKFKKVCESVDKTLRAMTRAQDETDILLHKLKNDENLLKQQMRRQTTSSSSFNSASKTSLSVSETKATQAGSVVSLDSVYFDEMAADQNRRPSSNNNDATNVPATTIPTPAAKTFSTEAAAPRSSVSFEPQPTTNTIEHTFREKSKQRRLTALALSKSNKDHIATCERCQRKYNQSLAFSEKKEQERAKREAGGVRPVTSPRNRPPSGPACLLPQTSEGDGGVSPPKEYSDLPGSDGRYHNCSHHNQTALLLAAASRSPRRGYPMCDPSHHLHADGHCGHCCGRRHRHNSAAAAASGNLSSSDSPVRTFPIAVASPPPDISPVTPNPYMSTYPPLTEAKDMLLNTSNNTAASTTYYDRYGNRHRLLSPAEAAARAAQRRANFKQNYTCCHRVGCAGYVGECGGIFFIDDKGKRHEHCPHRHSKERKGKKGDAEDDTDKNENGGDGSECDSDGIDEDAHNHQHPHLTEIRKKDGVWRRITLASSKKKRLSAAEISDGPHAPLESRRRHRGGRGSGGGNGSRDEHDDDSKSRGGGSARRLNTPLGINRGTFGTRRRFSYMRNEPFAVGQPRKRPSLTKEQHQRKYRSSRRRWRREGAEADEAGSDDEDGQSLFGTHRRFLSSPVKNSHRKRQDDDYNFDGSGFRRRGRSPYRFGDDDDDGGGWNSNTVAPNDKQCPRVLGGSGGRASSPPSARGGMNTATSPRRPRQPSPPKTRSATASSKRSSSTVDARQAAARLRRTQHTSEWAKSKAQRDARLNRKRLAQEKAEAELLAQQQREAELAAIERARQLVLFEAEQARLHQIAQLDRRAVMHDFKEHLEEHQRKRAELEKKFAVLSEHLDGADEANSAVLNELKEKIEIRKRLLENAINATNAAKGSAEGARMLIFECGTECENLLRDIRAARIDQIQNFVGKGTSSMTSMMPAMRDLLVPVILENDDGTTTADAKEAINHRSPPSAQKTATKRCASLFDDVDGSDVFANMATPGKMNAAGGPRMSVSSSSSEKNKWALASAPIADISQEIQARFGASMMMHFGVGGENRNLSTNTPHDADSNPLHSNGGERSNQTRNPLVLSYSSSHEGNFSTSVEDGGAEEEEEVSLARHPSKKKKKSANNNVVRNGTNNPSAPPTKAVGLLPPIQRTAQQKKCLRQGHEWALAFLDAADLMKISAGNCPLCVHEDKYRQEDEDNDNEEEDGTEDEEANTCDASEATGKSRNNSESSGQEVGLVRQDTQQFTTDGGKEGGGGGGSPLLPTIAVGLSVSAPPTPMQHHQQHQHQQHKIRPGKDKKTSKRKALEAMLLLDQSASSTGKHPPTREDIDRRVAEIVNSALRRNILLGKDVNALIATTAAATTASATSVPSSTGNTIVSASAAASGINTSPPQQQRAVSPSRKGQGQQQAQSPPTIAINGGSNTNDSDQKKSSSVASPSSSAPAVSPPPKPSEAPTTVSLAADMLDDAYRQQVLRALIFEAARSREEYELWKKVGEEAKRNKEAMERVSRAKRRDAAMRKEIGLADADDGENDEIGAVSVAAACRGETENNKMPNISVRVGADSSSSSGGDAAEQTNITRENVNFLNHFPAAVSRRETAMAVTFFRHSSVNTDDAALRQNSPKYDTLYHKGFANQPTSASQLAPPSDNCNQPQQQGGLSSVTSQHLLAAAPSFAATDMSASFLNSTQKPTAEAMDGGGGSNNASTSGTPSIPSLPPIPFAATSQQRQRHSSTDSSHTATRNTRTAPATSSGDNDNAGDSDETLSTVAVVQRQREKLREAIRSINAQLEAAEREKETVRYPLGPRGLWYSDDDDDAQEDEEERGTKREANQSKMLHNLQMPNRRKLLLASHNLQHPCASATLLHHASVSDAAMGSVLMAFSSAAPFSYPARPASPPRGPNAIRRNKMSQQQQQQQSLSGASSSSASPPGIAATLLLHHPKPPPSRQQQPAPPSTAAAVSSVSGGEASREGGAEGGKGRRNSATNALSAFRSSQRSVPLRVRDLPVVPTSVAHQQLLLGEQQNSKNNGGHSLPRVNVLRSILDL